LISLISPAEVKNPTSIAIGSFDGLHAGHRKLIKSVVAENQYTPTIASFWPHPREVLYKETRLRLDLPNEKLSILEDLGIEQLVLIPFDMELSKLSAEWFVRDILLNQLQAKNISVGKITSIFKSDSQIIGLAMIKRKFLEEESYLFSEIFGKIIINKSVGSIFL